MDGDVVDMPSRRENDPSDGSSDLDEAQSLALEAALQGSVLTGANQREAVAANMAGREPEFED